MLNEAINLNNFKEFKEGMLELVVIEKQKNDVFYKHDSIYELICYVELVTNYGQEEQEITRFIEQLSSCKTYIDSEEKALLFENKRNAFLGINFSSTTISIEKQIFNDLSYKNWNFLILSKYEKLKSILENSYSSSNFKKDFNNLPENSQQSIIDEFIKAKKRGLVTFFYPDTKIIKDVSPLNYKCKVYELRVYTPIALRVYFNENNGNVFLASIEQKSNSDQNKDIILAHKILQNIIKT